MATGKKFFWMKLKESFMKSDTVDFLMELDGGAEYVVFYQMLCLLTINTGGRLERTIGKRKIRYDVSKLKRDCKWFSEKTIKAALKYFEEFELLYVDEDGIYCLADYHNLVGSESDYSEQKRSQRNPSSKKTDNGVDKDMDKGVDIVHSNVHTKNSESVDKDMDKSMDNVHIENRDKEIRDISSFIHSIAREENDAFFDGFDADSAAAAEKETEKVKALGGKLGGGVVMLSDKQIAELLELLSQDEFDKYVAIVRDCILNGKPFKRKTHFRAILDMAMADREADQCT